MDDNEVTIDVVGGLCQIKFQAGCSTGKDDDTRPGVSFDLVSDHPPSRMGDKYCHGMGVIGRKDAARLRDMLEIFLKAHARGDAAA